MYIILLDFLEHPDSFGDSETLSISGIKWELYYY